MSEPLLKVQEGGGCWFHAPLNGWLLSERGCEVISAMLAQYKSKHSINTSANLPHGAICPQRGHLPLNYFWRYVNLMLSNNRTKNPSNFISNFIIKNTGLRPIPGVSANINLKDLYDGYNINTHARIELARAGVNSINNLTHERLNVVTSAPLNKLKRWVNLSPNNKLKEINMIKAKIRSKHTFSGDDRDIHRFHRILFGDNYSEREQRVNENTVVFATPWTGSRLRRAIVRNNIRYTLSHACICMMPIDNKKYGHYVSGFIHPRMEGGMGMYDSEFPHVYRLDWVTNPLQIQNYAMQFGLLLHKQSSVVVYIRDGAANFASEINSLGKRRNDVAKYSRIRAILDSPHELADYLVAMNEFRKLPPNNNSRNYMEARSVVARETAKKVTMHHKLINQISSNRAKLVNHRNELLKPPLSRIPEFSSVLNRVNTLIRKINERNALARERAARTFAGHMKRKR